MLQHHHSVATKPQRVVVIGATGFVGGGLIRQLVHEQVEHLAIGSREIDLLQPESIAQLKQTVCEGDSLVIASCLTPDKGKDVATMMKNLVMVQHLAAFLEEARCEHVVYVGSDAVYDPRESLLRESSSQQPSDLWSVSHTARERILSFATAKTKTPLCIVRPSTIYGAADTHNAYGPNRFMRTAIKDRKITLFGGGEETRDHVYIDDVSRLLALCLLHRSAGVLNAVSGEAVTFRQLADKIVQLAGPDVGIECLPRGSAITHRFFDVTERIKAFPSFAPTPLDAGLSESFRQLSAAP